MKILAVTGSRYLLIPDDAEPGELEDDTRGRILDSATGRLYPWQNVHSIIMHTPEFEPFEGNQAILSTMLDEAEEVEFGEATGRR